MKKKKGFTLIELIAAIAILSIAMVSISSAVCAGANISAKNSKKVDTSVFAQNIIETYKSQGKNSIKELYLDKSDEFEGYCYFNDEVELNNVLEKKSEGLEDKRTSTDEKFEAYVQFQKVDIQSESGFYNIRIAVKVVDLKNVGKNDSSLVFYLGR